MIWLKIFRDEHTFKWWKNRTSAKQKSYVPVIKCWCIHVFSATVHDYVGFTNVNILFCDLFEYDRLITYKVFVSRNMFSLLDLHVCVVLNYDTLVCFFMNSMHKSIYQPFSHLFVHDNTLPHSPLKIKQTKSKQPKFA